jgi:hypothetical protein
MYHKIVQISDEPGADDDPRARSEAIRHADIAIDAQGVVFKDRYGTGRRDATIAELMRAVKI